MAKICNFCKANQSIGLFGCIGFISERYNKIISLINPVQFSTRTSYREICNKCFSYLSGGHLNNNC